MLLLLNKLGLAPPDFHSGLYLCAPEFDFISADALMDLADALVLPLAIVSSIAIAGDMAADLLAFWSSPAPQAAANTGSSNTTVSTTAGSKSHKKHATSPAHVYFLLQSTAFFLLAACFMRLKALWVPTLVVLAARLGEPGHICDLIHRCTAVRVPRLVYFTAFLGLFGMLLHGTVETVTGTLQDLGEQINPEFLEILQYIEERTPKNAAFVGDMAKISTVKAVTGRPIVNHPHYEDASLRERTLQIYHMFARVDDKAVWERLEPYQADYLLLDVFSCLEKYAYSPECTLARAMERLGQPTAGKTFCERWFEIAKKGDVAASQYFQAAASNEHYVVSAAGQTRT